MKKDYLKMATRRKKSSDYFALVCMTNEEELVFIRVFSTFEKLQTALRKEIQSLTDVLAGEGISSSLLLSHRPISIKTRIKTVCV